MEPIRVARRSSASLFESLRNIGAARNLGALSSPLANSRPISLRTPLILRLFTGKIATERNFLESRGVRGSAAHVPSRPRGCRPNIKASAEFWSTVLRMKFLGAVWLIPRFSGIPESARAWHRQVGQIERRPRNFGEIWCRRSLLGGNG